MKRNATYVSPSPYSNSRRRLSFGASYSGSKSSGSIAFGYDDASSEGLFKTSLTGGSSAKIGGFISTTLVPRGTINNKFNKYGVVRSYETGGVINGGANTSGAGNTVAVGHNNIPCASILLCAWESIIKRMMIRIGYSDLSDLQEALIGFSATDSVVVEYRVNNDTNIFTRTYIFGASETVSSIAGAFWAYFSSATGADTTLQFKSIRFVPVPSTTQWGAVRMNLTGCMVTFFGKSALKVQNRSVNTAGGDEEAVDNAPLQGKAYYGKGSGAVPYTKDVKGLVAAAGFFGNDKNGSIAKVPTESWYQEPPTAKHFANVKLFGKVLLEAGHIKTSVLYSEHNVPLDNLYRLLTSFRTDNNTNWTACHTKHSVGHFRFMLLEKMINSSVGTTANAINVGFEVNLRHGAFVTLKNNTMSADILEVAAIANEA